jgi:hypothetical protein
MPDDLELAKTFGLLAYQRKEYNSSMLFLGQYAEKSGDDGEVFLLFGHGLLRAQKDKRMPREALKKALDLGVADTLWPVQARTILKELK